MLYMQIQVGDGLVVKEIVFKFGFRLIFRVRRKEWIFIVVLYVYIYIYYI